MGLHRGCQGQCNTLKLLPSRGRGLSECLLQRTEVLCSGSMPTCILACSQREAKDDQMTQMGPTMVVLWEFRGKCHQANMKELTDTQDMSSVTFPSWTAPDYVLTSYDYSPNLVLVMDLLSGGMLSHV